MTGYINFKRGFYIDADAAPTTDAEFDQNDKVRQFSQELRLAGGSADKLTWLLGAYYSWDRVLTYSPGHLHDIFNTNVLITANQETKSRRRLRPGRLGAEPAAEAGDRAALHRRGSQLRWAAPATSTPSA